MKKISRYLLLLALLGGCSSLHSPFVPAPAPAPVAAPMADTDDPVATWYRNAVSTGKLVYRVETGESLIAVTVRRGGALSRLGHDHVVASRGITGYVAPDAGRADFQFRLDQMIVDEPGLRKEAGLDTVPDAQAIAGTRTNMLTKVLEAERFPVVVLHAETVPGKGDKLNLSITLHGVTRTIVVPTKVESSAGRVVASGAFTLKQTDFGIKPMSIMGGAVSVQDPMELRFRIVATSGR